MAYFSHKLSLCTDTPVYKLFVYLSGTVRYRMFGSVWFLSSVQAVTQTTTAKIVYLTRKKFYSTSFTWKILSEHQLLFNSYSVLVYAFIECVILHTICY